MKGKCSEKDIQKHCFKYAWINTVLFEDRPYTVDYYKKRIKELNKQSLKKDYLKNISEEKKLQYKQKKLMQKIREYKELYRITKAVQIFGFLRSFRIDVLHISYGNCWGLIEEITKRLDIRDLDLRHLDYKEIHQSILLKDKFYKKKIHFRRNKKTISLAINNQRLEISEAGTIKNIEMIVKEDDAGDFTQSVRGSIAYPGKIVAKCKVLNNVQDIKKVKRGDVIVISMTDPNYIPAMEKASAFVTDFGGILCHAAIVSREMKKPCIIGTKTATNIFKDGDMLEVDATKGVVKRI